MSERTASRPRLIVDAPRQPRRDLLQQPGVAVRIAEAGEGAVRGAIGGRAADAGAGMEPVAQRALMEDLADVDAAGDEVSARGVDVADDQVHALGRTGRGAGRVRAELDRARRAGRGELDDPEAVVAGEVG